MFDFNKLRNFRPDAQKAKDTGMAMVLLLLIIGLWRNEDICFKIALVVLLIDMIVPKVFTPLAYIWFGIAYILGTVSSKILLFLVYMIMVLPVGIIRRMSGKDVMLVQKWKKSHESVFKTRNHLFTAADIDKPY
jgi:hypothetical protein